MSTQNAWQLLLFAGALFAGSTLVLGTGFAAAMQKSASQRHLVWAAAFGALLVLPLLALALPSLVHIAMHTDDAPPPTLPVAAVSTTAPAMIPPPAQPGDSFAPDRAVFVLGVVWLLGAGAIAARILFDALCLALLRRRSRAFALTPDCEPRIAATKRECELRIAHAEIGPVTWGLFQPVILLPRSAASWTRPRLHAVLLHELAHIRRRDTLVQAMQQIVCALYWPNPLVWIAARRLRREAEIAADDAALATGMKASDYAEELVRLAGEFRRQRLTAAGLSLPMAAPSSLEARVRAVLSSDPSRKGVTKMDVLKGAGAAMIAAAALACARPTLAQVEPPAAPAPVETAVLPPPSAPAEAPAPPAVPALAAPAVMPAPPAPPADRAEETPHMHVIVRMDGNSHPGMRRVRLEIERARRQALAEVERQRPEIDKAMAQARAGEEAMRAARPQIEDAMAQIERQRPQLEAALAKAKPDIDRALARMRQELARQHVDVRIEENIDRALKKAEIRIQVGDANRRHDHGDVRIEERTDSGDRDGDGDSRVEQRSDDRSAPHQ